MMSPRRIIQLLTGMALLIALTWLVTSPDYEPALTVVVMLTALIGEIIEEKYSVFKPVDTDLFLKLKNELPSNGSIQFIAENDMAEPSFVMVKLND